MSDPREGWLVYGRDGSLVYGDKSNALLYWTEWKKPTPYKPIYVDATIQLGTVVIGWQKIIQGDFWHYESSKSMGIAPYLVGESYNTSSAKALLNSELYFEGAGFGYENRLRTNQKDLYVPPLDTGVPYEVSTYAHNKRLDTSLVFNKTDDDIFNPPLNLKSSYELKDIEFRNQGTVKWVFGDMNIKAKGVVPETDRTLRYLTDIGQTPTITGFSISGMQEETYPHDVIYGTMKWTVDNPGVILNSSSGYNAWRTKLEGKFEITYTYKDEIVVIGKRGILP